MPSQPRRSYQGDTTTSQPIYRQCGRKSASLVQLGPDTPTSRTGWQLVPYTPPPFGIRTVFILSAMVTATWLPTGATLAESWSGMLTCNTALGQLELTLSVSPLQLPLGTRTLKKKSRGSTYAKQKPSRCILSRSVRLLYAKWDQS